MTLCVAYHVRVVVHWSQSRPKVNLYRKADSRKTFVIWSLCRKLKLQVSWHVYGNWRVVNCWYATVAVGLQSRVRPAVPVQSRALVTIRWRSPVRIQQRTPMITLDELSDSFGAHVHCPRWYSESSISTVTVNCSNISNHCSAAATVLPLQIIDAHLCMS